MSSPRPLGRRVPETWDHVNKYPLTAVALPSDPVPVVLGINWYTAFDDPVDDKGNPWSPGKVAKGRWWIGKDAKNLGSVRGGHSVCCEPGSALNADGTVRRNLQDAISWYSFYNQGFEGACVGFGSSRMMSLLNRKRFDARWLWDWAKATDEFTDTAPGDDNGTSVNAAMAILLNRGHVVWRSALDDFTVRDAQIPKAAEGINAFRWATAVDEVRAVLKSPANDRVGAVRILNSWGTDYPHRVWMPYETLQRVIDEEGEASLVTDR